MNEYIVLCAQVLIIFCLVVLGWKYLKGYYPGSSYVIEDPPITKNGLEPEQAKFMFFYTTWCPWSRLAKEKWSSFKQLMKNNPGKYGKYTLLFEDIDCEANKGKAALYSVNAYPTFKLITSEKTYVMQGTPDPKTFDLFLTAVLGQKSSS